MDLGWELATVLAGLLLFGIGYNRFVTWLERQGHDRGYTALLVVGGVLVTLAGAIPITGWWTIMVITLCFVASGTPMIVGSIWRHIQARAREDEALRQAALEVLNGDAA